MSRDLGPQNAPGVAGDKPQDVDLDAEHDPDVSRRASNAALRRVAVQMKAGAEAKEPAQQAAERGVQSATTALPHGETIQRAFGAHDISHIQAHVGDGSARAMGAEAYATGHHVVFDKQPDLHTAAHEAAHVVQQARGVNLYGGVGEAGDAYERNADEVADRVVQGKSAEDLLGQPASAGGAQGGAVQKKTPSQGDADQHVLAAIQAHVKLTAARMQSGAAHVRALLKSDTSGPAGFAPMMIQLEEQQTAVNNDLDNLAAEISKVPDVLKGHLDAEFGTIVAAFHSSWAPALNSINAFTHDENGKVRDFAAGLSFDVTAARNKMQAVFRAAGGDEMKIKAVQAPGIRDPAHAVEQRDEELKDAETEALKQGMSSVEAALDLVKADLHSSVADMSKEALDLTVSVENLVAVFEPISPDHIGKIAKLPALIKQVEALQGEVDKMKQAGEDKGKALAPKIGYNTTLSSNLKKLKDKIKSVDFAHKANKKH